MDISQSFQKFELLNRHSITGNFFQSREFYSVVDQIGWKPQVITAMDGNECEGGLIAYIPEFTPILSKISHGIFVRDGPILKYNSNALVLDRLLENLETKTEQNGCIRIDIKTPLSLRQYEEVFQKHGYVQYNTNGEYSVFIDLRKDLNTLEKELKKACRKRIKKAVKKGVYVKDVETLEELNDLYDIYLKTAKRRNFSPYPLKFFKTFWIQLRPVNLCQFYIALYKEKVIAGKINTCYLGKVTTFITCSLKEHWGLHPNQLLVWHSIRNSKENVHAYIFDISNLPAAKNSGQEIDYYTFKTSFGGTLARECTFYYKVISPVKHCLSQHLAKILRRGLRVVNAV